MRRHVIVGRFGPHDTASVAVAPDEVATFVDLVEGQRRLRHGIGQALEDLGRIDIFPTELGLDFLILAAHVYAADTRISRGSESQDAWTREIRLVVPVTDPMRWAAVAPVLKRMLNFLTGDRWTIDVRPRPREFDPLVTTRGKSVDQRFDRLSLFSGGLDSLIGAIDTLESGGVPLLISHTGEGATSQAQDACFRALKEFYDERPFDRLRVWMSFRQELIPGVSAERTNRARSFLFFAIGILAGTGLGGAFTLYAPENGLIALNVPLDPLRLGSLSTHTTHPFYMARWNELLTALDVPGRIENPYWDRTKGEMVASCANPVLLGMLIPSSLSCSSPAKGRWQNRGIEHCGYCVPCLIRRAALQAALGEGMDPTIYTIPDLSAQVLDTRRSIGQQVRSFQFAINRLRTNPEIAKLLIHKPGPLSDEPSSHLPALADVYRRGIGEVASLLEGVRSAPR